MCAPSYTYEGATCGRIADVVREWGVEDGILYFDELDKVSKARGDDITNVLIHLTVGRPPPLPPRTPTVGAPRPPPPLRRRARAGARVRTTRPDTSTPPPQHRLAGSRAERALPRQVLPHHSIDLDLSKAIVVFSYNDESQINPVLRDRLLTIRFGPPTREDKVAIAREHFVPRALRNANLGASDIVFDDATLRLLVDHCGDEPGMRGMDRAIERILNTPNVAVHGSAAQLRAVKLADMTLPLKVTADVLETVLDDPPARPTATSLMYA